MALVRDHDKTEEAATQIIPSDNSGKLPEGPPHHCFMPLSVFLAPTLRVAENRDLYRALHTGGARALLHYTSLVGRCSGGSENALKREEVESGSIAK
jgi:hypothetical protein